MLSYSQTSTETGLQVGPINLGAELSTDTESPETGSPPRVAGSCWTSRSANGFEILFGLFMTIFGITIIAFGFVNEHAQPGEELASLIAYCCFGGIILAIGLFALLARRLSKHYGLEATDVGFELITKRTSTSYRWEDIEKVLVGQFTPSNTAATEVFLTMEPKKGKPIKVRSTFEGDPEIVIEQILTHCDYIVRNPEAYTKNQK